MLSMNLTVSNRSVFKIRHAFIKYHQMIDVFFSNDLISLRCNLESIFPNAL
jgi:hypothetical protein